MKRYGGLWERLVSWDNLILAARLAQRRKRRRLAVHSFNFNLDRLTAERPSRSRLYPREGAA